MDKETEARKGQIVEVEIQDISMAPQWKFVQVWDGYNWVTAQKKWNGTTKETWWESIDGVTNQEPTHWCELPIPSEVSK